MMHGEPAAAEQPPMSASVTEMFEKLDAQRRRMNEELGGGGGGGEGDHANEATAPSAER